MARPVQPMVGKRFNSWTVLEKVATSSLKDRYRVQCDCGTVTEGYGQHLRTGASSKCRRCASSKLKVAPVDRAHNQIRTVYVYGAKQRGLCWELSRERFEQLILMPCNYCKQPPQMRSGYYETYNRKPQDFGMSGIDRVDSSIGYTETNSVPCCSKCNFMKGVMDVQDFINQCKLISVRNP